MCYIVCIIYVLIWRLRRLGRGSSEWLAGDATDGTTVAASAGAVGCIDASSTVEIEVICVDAVRRRGG